MYVPLFILTSNDDSIRNLSVFCLSIYIYKEQCLSVRYAFSLCDSQRHQTFHDTTLGPEEGQERIGVAKGE